MQEWQAALALLEDLLKPHCKGDGSDDNGTGKEFFVSSHLVQGFEIPNHIGNFSATKPLKTVHLT